MGQIKHNKINKEKSTKLHPRNAHISDDFLLLSERYPELKKFVNLIKGKIIINYNDPKTLYCISKVLLHYRYNIVWEMPDKFLIPTIPSRANYVHFISDILTPEHYYNTETIENEKFLNYVKTENCSNRYLYPVELIPRGEQILGIDIGIGANCIFSLLCNKIYSWKMVGTDISIESLEASDNIIKKNNLTNSISLLLQENPEDILFGILNRPELETLNFTFTICNPPYYDSIGESKVNLHPNRFRNCQEHEIITQGGEFQFILKLYLQSKKFPKRVIWYTSQVSKLKNLKNLKSALGKEVIKNELKSVRYATLKQGKHDKWVIAWSFFEKEERTSILKFLRNNKSLDT